jgi:hypothetical protein
LRARRSHATLGAVRAGELGILRIVAALAFLGAASCVQAGTAPPPPPAEPLSEQAPPEEPSKFYSPEDGWLDVSGFLKQKYGFLPIAVPITEPAVGYGAAVGLAFLSKPLGEAKDGLGRPDITVVAGLGTENDTRALAIGDVRHWMDDRLQTQAALMHASVNLDFHGVGDDPTLDDDPLSYTLEPEGGILQGKVRLGETRFWTGLKYSFAATRVTFDAPPGTPGLPDIDTHSNVGGLTPSVTYDTRDNMFTPNQGTYVEGTAGLFSQALGGDDEFQRVRVLGLQYVPLHADLDLGVLAEGTAAFGDAPFYALPFIGLRGAPVMRYQGEQMAQLETELRWRCWKRFSLVGFGGVGSVWNDLENFDDEQTIATGGTGFRYEIARDYGIHMGLDVAFSPEGPAIYVQVGSAWARP